MRCHPAIWGRETTVGALGAAQRLPEKKGLPMNPTQTIILLAIMAMLAAALFMSWLGPPWKPRPWPSSPSPSNPTS